jgi:hypothetical protein
MDTGVLYAATDRADAHHERCRDWIMSNTEVLLIPATVVAEVCYLIDRTLGPEAEAAFLDDVGTGPEAPYRLVELVDQDLRRMAELVRRYADRRLGATDASIVAVCERLDLDTIASLNYRDFANLRPSHRPALRLVPE